MISVRLPNRAMRLVWRHRIVAATSAAALVFAVDAIFARAELTLPLKALLDEAAHLATALLLLGALIRRPSASFVLGAALGSVLIDVDHIPLTVAHHGDLYGVPRPDTHSLLTILVVAGVARLLPARYRAFGFGAAFGIAAHLTRDMTTGGVPLLWPLTPDFLHLPYITYANILLICLAIIVWRVWAAPTPSHP